MRWGITLLVALAACSRATTPEPSPAPEAAGLEWLPLAPVPTPRTEVAAATDGHLIYVVGGFDASGASVGTLEIYSRGPDAWTSGPDLPIAVNHAMGAALDETVYVLGGYTGPLSDPTDRAFALRNNEWVELPPMPEPRAAAGAAVAGGRIWVAGGVGPDGLADTMLVFDPDAERWATAPGPPTAREHLGVAGFADRVYVVGGRTGGIGTNLADAEVFDTATGEWASLPRMPTARGGIAAAATDNGFVVAAGGEAGATFAEAEALHVPADEWIALPGLPTPRHGLGVVSLGTVLYVVAGGPQPGLTVSGANEAIDLASLGH